MISVRCVPATCDSNVLHGVRCLPRVIVLHGVRCLPRVIGCAAVGIRAPQPTILNTVQFLVQDQFMKADNIFYTSIEGGKAVI